MDKVSIWIFTSCVALCWLLTAAVAFHCRNIYFSAQVGWSFRHRWTCKGPVHHLGFPLPWCKKPFHLQGIRKHSMGWYKNFHCVVKYKSTNFTLWISLNVLISFSVAHNSIQLPFYRINVPFSGSAYQTVISSSLSFPFLFLSLRKIHYRYFSTTVLKRKFCFVIMNDPPPPPNM